MQNQIVVTALVPGGTTAKDVTTMKIATRKRTEAFRERRSAANKNLQRSHGSERWSCAAQRRYTLIRRKVKIGSERSVWSLLRFLRQKHQYRYGPDHESNDDRSSTYRDGQHDYQLYDSSGTAVSKVSA